MNRAVPLVIIVACSPALQGAGCRAHYAAHLRGELTTDPALAAERAGKDIVVIYRTRDASTNTCTDDWAPCLSAPGWQKADVCDATASPAPPVVKVTADGAMQSFDACTSYIGVDYRADIAAFIDANGDAKPSPGEVYGVFAGNPLTRDAEPTALPLAIKLDRTLP